jgi:hypothetical protein
MNGTVGTVDVHAAAAEGTSGSGGTLPHANKIQASFGSHNIGSISAHTDAGAAEATSAMGANAYASGKHVAFARGKTDLHTAAHEAAHVVQQSAGVQLSGGVGQASDKYERHADAVADKVVAGQSAEGLLSEMTGGASSSGASIQFDQDPPSRIEQGANVAELADNTVGTIDQSLGAYNAGKEALHASSVGTYNKSMTAYTKSQNAWDAQEAYGKTWMGWASQKVGWSEMIEKPTAPSAPLPFAETKMPGAVDNVVKGGGGIAGMVAGAYEAFDGGRDIREGSYVDGGLKVANGISGAIDGSHSLAQVAGSGLGDYAGSIGETAGEYAGTLGSAIQGLQGAKGLLDISNNKAKRQKIEAAAAQANGKPKEALDAIVKYMTLDGQDGHTGTMKGIGGVIGGIGAGVALLGSAVMSAPVAAGIGAGMMAAGKGTAALKGMADMTGFGQATDSDKTAAKTTMTDALKQLTTELPKTLKDIPESTWTPHLETYAKIHSAANNIGEKGHFKPVFKPSDWFAESEWNAAKEAQASWLS